MQTEKRVRAKPRATLPFLERGGAMGRGPWKRAASEEGGKPGLSGQVKKGLDKECVSAESKAAESSNKTRTKNGPMNLARWRCRVILTGAVTVDTREPGKG